MNRERGPLEALSSQILRCMTLCLAASGCSDWRNSVQTGLADSDPEQTMLVDAAPFSLASDSRVQLTPRAIYKNAAWAVAVDNSVEDDWSDIIQLDVSLAWGPVADPDVLKHMRFRIDERYVTVRWDGDLALNSRQIMRHIANHHLIPSSVEIREDLAIIRPGDFVELEGKLVDIQSPAGRFDTSVSRKDRGSGACEVVWVEHVVIARPR